MPPISNSDRIGADRPRREARIVYTREDRRPIRERGLDRAGIWSKRDRNAGTERSAGEYRGCVATAATGAEEACRRSAPSAYESGTRSCANRPCLASRLALDRHRRRIYRCRSTCARSPRSPSRGTRRMQARASRGPRESDSRLAAALRRGLRRIHARARRHAS